MERPTLSQSWNRVDKLTPKLRAQVQIRRQLFRGEAWYVVHDPISNQFFRLNPVAYFFVGLLDGRRTVDEAWRLTLDRHGDAAPTQNEVIGLLGQLNSSNLLRVDDLPANAEPLLKRHNERKFKKWSGQLMNILFMRIPMLNPEPYLKWLQPFFNPILNRWGFIAWCAWLIFSLYVFLPHFGRFLGSAYSVLAPSNWGWMIVLFIVTKLIHETGHGLMCKRFGGAVPEVGIMLLVLFPAPFVDATSSWNFPQKHKRILVAAAGMMFELALAGLAAVLWVSAADGSLLQQLSYNVVFLASVTTILFNANPLIRFDGYYILSDTLDVPNMYERSKKHLYWLVKRFIYGMENVYPSSTSTYESFVMTCYGIASSVYKVLLLTGIILFIMGQFFFIGIILACWSLIAWMIVPMGKFLRWLFTDPSLSENRPRALATTGAFVAAVVVLIGVIPVPERRWAKGVVESEQKTEVAVQTDGFVKEVLVEPGQQVEPGDVILRAHNQDLLSRRAELEAEFERMQSMRLQSLAKGEHAQVQAHAEMIATTQKAMDDLDRRIEELVVRAPLGGTIVASRMKQLRGQFTQRGQVVCRIERLDQLKVTSVLDQSQNSELSDKVGKAELRTAGNIKRVLDSEVLRFPDSASHRLPHPSLGYGGGGDIAVDKKDEKGLTPLQGVFLVPLKLPLVLGDAERIRRVVADELSELGLPAQSVAYRNLPEAAHEEIPPKVYLSLEQEDGRLWEGELLVDQRRLRLRAEDASLDAVGASLAGATAETIDDEASAFEEVVAIEKGRVDVKLPGRPAALPGQRVHVRFTLKEKRPLAFQWYHRLRQIIRARLSS